MSSSPTPTELPLADSMVLTDEKLERVFREIEEASERRALEEEEEAASHPGPLDPFVSALTNAELMSAKKRRRQSISISRVGSYADVPAELGSGPGSPVPWSSPPPLYRANTRTSTTSSLSTAASSFASGLARDEEENHTTQKETIAARRNTLTKAMSSALSRTLTRMRSRGAINEVLPDDEALVIGVAVHEATTEERTTIDLSGDGPVSPLDEGERRRGASVGDLPRVQSRVEIGTIDPLAVAEAGPSSRRMSITVSASVSAVNPKQEMPRSRSGSINKLRGKLPLKGQTHAATPSTEVKQPVAATSADDDPGILSGAEEVSGKECGKGQKSSRRISYFAKALAQKLRRRRSGDYAEREKDGSSSEKEKERKKGKQKSASDLSQASGSQRSDKSSNSDKTGKRISFVPPVPIYTEPSVAVSQVEAAARLDQPIIKSPLLVAPSLSEPSVSTSSGSGTGFGSGAGLSVNEGSVETGGIGALPPSPRRLPSTSDIPRPSSSASSPKSPSTTNVTAQNQPDGASSNEKIMAETEPAMIPLPPTPVTLAFPHSETSEEGSGSVSVSAPIAIANGESRWRRLPPSALPDSDFGPMGETTPAPTPTPSPTESTMTVPVLVSAPSRDVSCCTSRRESSIVAKDEERPEADLVGIDVVEREEEKDVPQRREASESRDDSEEKKEEVGVEVKIVPRLDPEKVYATSEKTIEL